MRGVLAKKIRRYAERQTVGKTPFITRLYYKKVKLAYINATPLQKKQIIEEINRKPIKVKE